MERIYRSWVKQKDLVIFEVVERQTDLLISADRDLSGEARVSVGKFRHQLETYIAKYPEFETSLEPLRAEQDAPDIVKTMAQAGEVAGVGPMAAVAGAVAEFVGKELLIFTGEVIVENGGDIFLKSDLKRKVAIFAGESPLTKKLSIEVQPDQTPLGVCTSSGTVGPSLSFGKADAVVVLSESTALADAVATATANLVKDKSDTQKAMDFAKSIKGVDGVLIVVGQTLGAWGAIKMLPGPV